MAHEPTIEIPSESDVEPKGDGEVASESHQDKDMKEDSYSEEEFDEY